MEKNSTVTIFVNYLIIVSLALFGIYILIFAFNIKPELTVNTVSFVILPVFLDWVISIITILSLKVLVPLRLINVKARFSPENIFFLMLFISFFLAFIYLVYNLYLPHFFVFSSFILYILPILYVKNIWFLLQYREKMLQRGYTVSIAIFLIIIFLLAVVQLVGDLFTDVSGVMLDLFDGVFYSSAALYFIFMAYLSYHFITKKKWEELE